MSGLAASTLTRLLNSCCVLVTLGAQTPRYLLQKCAVTAAPWAEVSGRVNSVLNYEITGQHISSLPANLTLSSNGPLDHPDMLEGCDDDRGQDRKTPVFRKAAFPWPGKSHSFHQAVGGWQGQCLNLAGIVKCLDILFP